MTAAKKHASLIKKRSFGLSPVWAHHVRMLWTLAVKTVTTAMTPIFMYELR